MSVLSCSRRGCSNVMCRRLSPVHGYICDECFEELIALGPEANIKNFMLGNKVDRGTEKEARARFNAAFPFTGRVLSAEERAGI